MKTQEHKIVDINDLADVCDFFNGKTPVNNGYGCEHKDCEEWELVKVSKNGEHLRESYLKEKILKIAMRKKYGSVAQIELALGTKEGKEYYNKLKYSTIYQPNFVQMFGCYWQGRCHSFSCPIAQRCDVQDLKEYESDFLSDYEGEDDDYMTDLMLVTDPNLIEKL
ncbi:hypothetical protein WAF17_16575 [Bernardetia sp. ABR2-2B]|uniref:hypothetical protein n=1 Tax=Bernardetia sp. ABR2-2B TaxID=3127472 RepID=UPI0030CFC89E